MTVGPRKWLMTACILAMSAGIAIAQEPARKIPARSRAPARAKRASIYDKAADAKVQVARAVERAKKDDKGRILLMFGGDWCGWCHKLHGLFQTNREVAKILSYEYVLVTVDTEAPNAAELLKTCKDALSQDELRKGVGYPFLAVLDADGKVVTAQCTDPLEEGDHHDPKKVADFLNTWKVPAKDANVSSTTPWRGASSDDKRVFLTFGAPWCGWCHRLHDWMAQPEIAAILDRDFVIAQVDIDRMTGGKDIQKRYQPPSPAASPGSRSSTPRARRWRPRTGPGGNIGYPAAREIGHFLSMIEGQGRRIDKAQRDQLRKSLEEAAERLKRPAGH